MMHGPRAAPEKRRGAASLMAAVLATTAFTVAAQGGGEA